MTPQHPRQGSGQEPTTLGPNEAPNPDHEPKDTEKAAEELPSYTPQSRTGEHAGSEADESTRLPGHTPQGRTDS